MNTNYRAVCAFKWLTVLMPSLGQARKWHWRKGNFILFLKKVHIHWIYHWIYQAYTKNHENISNITMERYRIDRKDAARPHNNLQGKSTLHHCN